MDEEPISAWMDRKVIVWRTTQKCNVSCRFCFYSAKLGGTRMSANPEDVLRIGDLLSKYHRKHQKPAPLVSWIGGEPFLWRDLEAISRRFQTEYGFGLSVTTNGTQLHLKDVRDLVLDCFEEIIVSLDGIGSFNDWCRDRKNLYEELKDHILRLQEEKTRRNKRLKIKVNTVLMRGNIEQFEALCWELQSWGVEALSFNALGGRSRPEFFPDNQLQPDQVTRFIEELPRIRAAMGARGFVIHGSYHYLKRIKSSTGGIPVPVDDCFPGSRFLFISELGTMAPCSDTLAEYGIPFSEITNVDDIGNIEARFRALKSRDPAKSCGDCRCTFVFGKFE